MRLAAGWPLLLAWLAAGVACGQQAGSQVPAGSPPAGAEAAGETGAGAGPGTLACFGALQQGGLVICLAPPGTAVEIGGTRLVADETGSVQFGLARDAPSELFVRHDGMVQPLAIAPRQDAQRTVRGLDCDKVDARTPSQKAHAADSFRRKQAGFAAFHPGAGALDGFILPADAPPSSPFGPTRRYIGVSATSGEACESLSVHQGFDLATPTGTTVRAPADGIITLAEEDLYYEGGTIFLDHGHGLMSVFMHLSQLDVEAGTAVARGEVIARSGNTGRSTGPHLHWAVKWRHPQSEDRDGDFYIDPALLLALPGPQD